jgi:hypothetical protein
MIGGSTQNRKSATARRVRADRSKGVRIVPPASAIYRLSAFCMMRRRKWAGKKAPEPASESGGDTGKNKGKSGRGKRRGRYMDRKKV